MKFSSLLSVLALAMQPAFAHAKAPMVVPLPYSGKWELNYDENSCHLFGRFGTDQDAITMKMTSYQPGDQFDLTLFGRPLETKYQIEDLQLDFGIPDGKVKIGALAGKNGPIPWLLAMNISFAQGKGPRKPAQIPASRTSGQMPASVLVSFGGKSWRLETGPLDGPMQSLHACEVDLVRHWGFDPDVQLKRSQPPVPIGNVGNWARITDYPDAAMDRNISGLVKFRLDIEADGAISKCEVLDGISQSDFAKATCDTIMKRGRFKPALGQSGQPVRSFWVSSVRWLTSVN